MTGAAYCGAFLKGGEWMQKTFYEYVLTYRGGDWDDPKSRFAEAAFYDEAFPKQSKDFEELSAYFEMIADEHLTTEVFDELWSNYAAKYS